MPVWTFSLCTSSLSVRSGARVFLCSAPDGEVGSLLGLEADDDFCKPRLGLEEAHFNRPTDAVRTVKCVCADRLADIALKYARDAIF